MSNANLIAQKLRDLDRLVFEYNSISPKLALHAELRAKAQALAAEVKALGGDAGALSSKTIAQTVHAKHARQRANRAV